MLLFNTWLVFLVVYLSADFSHGQTYQKFFRMDYNYIEAVDSFYKFHSTEMNWRDAKRACAQEGASLFYPDNSNEANAVISFWKQYQNNSSPTFTWIHVGLTDMLTEGQFETIDGKLISQVYKNWRPDQPDNYYGNEDCVHLNQEGQINDIKCDDYYSFICKKTLKALERNYTCNVQQSELGQQRLQSFFPNGYNYIEAVDNFYKFFTSEMDWRGAKQACALEEASLFYPENSEEANAVISFWKRFQNNSDPTFTWIHVGLTDIITEGEFETLDGKSISEVYRNWRPDQPDNCGDEDCVHLNQDGQINDITCDKVYSFICKKRPILLNEPGNKKFFRKDYSYIEATDDFYKIHTTKKTWAEARRTCALEGAKLFYPDNRNEAEAVISFWKSSHCHSNIPWAFVGLSDIVSEGVFETVDGKPISEVYNQWQSGDPNDSSGNDDCVHLNLQGDINDVPCDEKSYFICKKQTAIDLPLELNYNCDKTKLVTTPKKTFFRTDYNYIEAVDSFYKFHSTEMTWNDAKRACAQEGASLFYPDSIDEANAVISYWKQYQSSGCPTYTWIHVGLTDILVEGQFETIDGKPISEVYNNWRSDQPDDCYGGEDCVHFNQEGQINDIKCYNTHSFICKKSFKVPVQNYRCSIQSPANIEARRNDKTFREDYSYVQTAKGFYKFHTTPQTWADAKRTCALEGASLFYPDNRDEANAVISFWRCSQPNTKWVFVGMSDIISEGVFKTVDGKSVSQVYNQWQLGEPNNMGGNEDCVHLNLQGDINDVPCDGKSNFICKRSLQSLEWNAQCNMSNTDYTIYQDVGKCYKLHTTPLNWIDAYSVCRAEQSHLAVIDDQLEADYLANLTQSASAHRVEGDYFKGIYHMGYHNKLYEGWQTVRGAPMDLEASIWWDNHQPHDTTCNCEQCGSMFYTGRLSTIDCKTKSLFICEHIVDGGVHF